MGPLLDLKIRTRRFAADVIKLSRELPYRLDAKVISEQMLRSGTSVGAHYREAIRSRSPSEYVAKLNCGLMELEETLYWIELLEDIALAPSDRLRDLKRESSELTAIFVSQIMKCNRRNDLPL